MADFKGVKEIIDMLNQKIEKNLPNKIKGNLYIRLPFFCISVDIRCYWRGDGMTVHTEYKRNQIIASSEIDDLIFMSTPQEWSFEEQKDIRDKLVREAFYFHYNRNEEYRNYCINQHVSDNLHTIDEIPVFPTSVFKYKKLHTVTADDIENWYTSSGTRGVKSHIARDRLSIERLLGSVNFGMKYVGDWFEHQMELINLGPDRFNTNNIWFKYVMSLVELLYPTEFTVDNDKIDFEKKQ